jgi:hypothetical protein
VETFSVLAWNQDARWVGPGAWSRKQLTNALLDCTGLQITEAKRLTRRLMNKELLEFPIVSATEAGHLLHILESQGARVEVRRDAP